MENRKMNILPTRNRIQILTNIIGSL